MTARSSSSSAVKLVIAAAALVLVFVAFLFFVQREMIYFPRRYDVPDVSQALPARWEALGFECGGTRQFVYWGPGPAASATDPVYFVFSGNATLALDWLDIVRTIQERHPALSFVLVDYPGYGHNGGYATRAGIVATSLAARAAVRDKLGQSDAALDARTHVVGHSLGAASGLEFAIRVRPRSVLLLAPFTSLVDMARGVVGWPLCQLVRDRFDNRARLRELAALPDRPSLRIHHGDQDRVISVEMGRALAREFDGWIEYHERRGFGHNDLVVDLATVLDETRRRPAGQ